MLIRRVYFNQIGPLHGHSAGLLIDDQARGSVCVRGPNGAGKSTWLRTVHKLWVWFRRSATRRKPAKLDQGDPGGVPGATAGMLVEGLPGPAPRLWLWQGSAEGWLAEVQATGEEAPVLISDPAFASAPNAIAPEALAAWEELFASAELGDQVLSNITLVEAEHRFIAELRQRDLQNPARSPAWIAAPRYNSRDGMDHLEVLMRGLALARKAEWAQLRAQLAGLLPGLTLLDDFDAATQRPRFQLTNGQLLTLDALSAGEKALLITLVTVLRFSSLGGVVLLDEPELHQHLSLMRGSLAALEELVVRGRGGQLIVASHAPEVWAHFRGAGAMIELKGRG